MPAFRAAVYTWRTANTQSIPSVMEAPETDLQCMELSETDLVKNELQVARFPDVQVDEAKSSQSTVLLPEFEGGEFPGCLDVCGQLQLIFTQLQYSCRRYDRDSCYSTLFEMGLVCLRSTLYLNI